MHKDSIKPGQKVVIVDDLIATGGTIEAAIKLVEQLGGEVVKVVFLMELAGLKGYKLESANCFLVREFRPNPAAKRFFLLRQFLLA